MADDQINPGTQGESPVPRRSGWVRWLRGTLAAVCGLYLGVLVAFWAIVSFGGDHWWVATVLMYGPRWVFALPLIGLAPAALLMRGRTLVVVVVSIVVLVGPVMRLCVPWRRVLMGDHNGLRLRVLSCNIHSGWLKGAAMGDLIAATRPDVVAFQEWSSRHQKAVFGDGQWFVLRDDELCIGSRYPIRKVVDLLPANTPYGAATCYELQAPGGKVYVVNLHLMSPHQVLEGVLDRHPEARVELEANSGVRLAEAGVVSGYARGVRGAVLLMGDFNMPEDSAGYRENWSGFMDAYTAGGLGFGYTYHTRHMRTRIDHVLGVAGWRCRRAWVGPDVGSPHRPVIADLEWRGDL